MPAILTENKLIEYLKTVDSPTLSNAIELLNARPHRDGFTPLQIRCLFPELGRMCGYAVTAQVETVTDCDAFDIHVCLHGLLNACGDRALRNGLQGAKEIRGVLGLPSARVILAERVQTMTDEGFPPACIDCRNPYGLPLVLVAALQIGCVFQIHFEAFDRGRLLQGIHQISQAKRESQGGRYSGACRADGRPFIRRCLRGSARSQLAGAPPGQLRKGEEDRLAARTAEAVYAI